MVSYKWNEEIVQEIVSLYKRCDPSERRALASTLELVSYIEDNTAGGVGELWLCDNLCQYEDDPSGMIYEVYDHSMKIVCLVWVSCDNKKTMLKGVYLQNEVPEAKQFKNDSMG